MHIKFWGVRGSIAAPGEETARIGGNTSCVELVCGATRIILDAGTGLRRLGDALMGEGRPIEAALLLSHFHWDHIQGLPFFVPAYVQTTRLEVVGVAPPRASLREAFAKQMQAPHFPVDLGDLGAEIAWREVRPSETFMVGEAKITCARLNHPGGVTAYRVEHRGRALVYATDTEHYACVDPVLRELARDADVLVYDAQYTPEEYAGTRGRSKVGWGHSTYVAGCEVAREAGARKLVLFHHDPTRSDEGVLAIEARASELVPGTIAAREGFEIELDPVSVSRAA